MRRYSERPHGMEFDPIHGDWVKVESVLMLQAEVARLRAVLSERCTTLAARDAEIKRLKSELSLAQFDARTDRAAAVQLGELVEKRERQLVWAVRACGDDEALKFYGLDIIAMSDDDAGLLAAIDEATEEK